MYSFPLKVFNFLDDTNIELELIRDEPVIVLGTKNNVFHTINPESRLETKTSLSHILKSEKKLISLLKAVAITLFQKVKCS